MDTPAPSQVDCERLHPAPGRLPARSRSPVRDGGFLGRRPRVPRHGRDRAGAFPGMTSFRLACIQVDEKSEIVCWMDA